MSDKCANCGLPFLDGERQCYDDVTIPTFVHEGITAKVCIDRLRSTITAQAAQIEGLREQLASLALSIADLSHPNMVMLLKECNDALTKLSAAEQKAEALRELCEALRKHGKHDDNCAYLNWPRDDPQYCRDFDCNCGLDALLAKHAPPSAEEQKQ